jgi:glycosyltransferase involved in cell wall biosynthesis
LPTIAIDMTPLLPRGNNGGAKVIILSLIHQFKNRQDDNNFILLTSKETHAELAYLDDDKIRRHCVNSDVKQTHHKLQISIPDSLLNAGLFILYQFNKRFQFIGQHLLRFIFSGRNGSRLLQELGVDLLFCPFSNVYFNNKKIPTITVIHDLLHIDYPWFLHRQERWKRDLILRRAVADSNILICDSEYTRQKIQSEYGISDHSIVKIQPYLRKRFPDVTDDHKNNMLHQMGINNIDFAFYPANFWPHKNHEMLIIAFQLFIHRHPDSSLHLVFTGCHPTREKQLIAAVKKMELDKKIHFLGYRSEEEMDAIWKTCKFLIFPSIHEGFGMPVVEAMTYEKPILCSNTTCLPEVAGEAALYFDPRKPEDIADKIERFYNDQPLRDILKINGKKQLDLLNETDVANDYLNLITKLVSPGISKTDSVIEA